MARPMRKVLDRWFGTKLRWVLWFIVHPFLSLRYRVSIQGAERALECVNGSIIVSNHISRLDGPFIMHSAWRFAFVRSTAWYAEYYSWSAWPFMILFSVIPLGSPKQPKKNWHMDLPEEYRQKLWHSYREYRRLTAKAACDKVLAAGRHLLIFCEGGIGRGPVVILPHLRGVYDLLESHPEKPVLMIRLEGLDQKLSSWFSRTNVSITIERFDRVSLEGGPVAFNKRLEAFYNDRTPLATVGESKIAA